MIEYIADKEHYTKVLALCEKVKHDLWIGTADLKDLYVEGVRDVVPFLSVLDRLLKGVSMCGCCMPKSQERISARISTSILGCGAVWSGDSAQGCISK